MALFPARGKRLRWSLHCAALLILFALTASPVLMMNMVEFHSPLKTGYDYWVPTNDAPFSVHYIPNIAAHLWREFALRPNQFSAAHLFGTGTCFVPAFIVLTGVGLFFIRVSRFVVCAFLAGLSFLGAVLSHRAPDVRYYLPLLILLVAVAALPVTWATKNLVEKRFVAALAIFVLFAAACLGYPSRSGYNAVAINRSQAWDALHFTVRAGKSTWFIAQRHFLQLFGRQPGIVLSDIDPAYLNTLLPESFVAAPLDGKHEYRFSKIWRYDKPEVLALLKRGLAESLPVYALFVSRNDMIQNASRLPELDCCQWAAVENSATEVLVLRLIRANGKH